jgi:phosphatidylglycerophosphate synthase
MQALSAMDSPTQRYDGNVIPGPGFGRSPRRRRAPAASLIDALLTVGACTVGTVVLAVATGQAFDLSPVFWIRAAMLACFGGAMTLWFASSRLAPARFGAANRLTSVRAAGVALVAAFVGEQITPGAAWTIVAFTIVLLILDGVDGRLARRHGQVSAFGARFDMETDAALTLVLAMLCWQADKAGAWILIVGLMRYAFVAAGLLWSWLARPLPYSRRRQTVCVLQLAGLLAVLSPLFPVPASSLVGLVTVLMLAGSFAVDIGWLAREQRHAV